MTEVPAFSGGYRDATEAVLWGVRFGRFGGTGQMLMAPTSDRQAIAGCTPSGATFSPRSVMHIWR